MSQEPRPLDAKALIAFVILIALILLIPNYWEWIGYKRPAPDRTPDGEPATTPETTVASPAFPADTAAPTAPRFSESPVPGFRADTMWREEFVRVETDVYDALFSTRGARLVRLVLKDYQYTHVGRRHENIVVLDTTDHAGLRIRFYDDRLDMSNAPFVANRPSVRVTGMDSSTVRFTARAGDGSEVTLAYTFHGARHDLGCVLSIPQPESAGLDREFYIGWEGGLWPTEPNPKDDNDQFAALALMGEDLEKVGSVDKSAPRLTLSGHTHWAAVRTKYFVCAVIPRTTPADGFVAESRERPWRYDGELISLKQFSAFARIPLAPRTPIQETFTVYLGPIEYSELKSYRVGLEDMVDLGWRWLIRPFALLVLWLFKTLHSIVPNYGVVIILFSLIIKVIFHPLTKKSMRSMRRMQALQPKMEKLRERFKDDAQRMNQEMMKLYRESGINPVSGCLPLLPQMPIFYALFQVFRTTIELRGAHFVGWLTDLSQKDPYYILPIVMTLSFFLQQRQSSKDPKQKMLTYILPLVFGFMFKDFPAGLTLYWTMYNVFSVIEQTWLIGHPEPSEGEGTVSSPVPSPVKKRSR